MKNENLKNRYEAVKAMHELVTGLNDETAYYEHWIYLVPDCPSDEDFWYIAEDVELFKEVCACFRRMIAVYGKYGFYIGEVLA